MNKYSHQTVTETNNLETYKIVYCKRFTPRMLSHTHRQIIIRQKRIKWSRTKWRKSESIRKKQLTPNSFSLKWWENKCEKQKNKLSYVNVCVNLWHIYFPTIFYAENYTFDMYTYFGLFIVVTSPSLPTITAHYQIIITIIEAIIRIKPHHHLAPKVNYQPLRKFNPLTCAK